MSKEELKEIILEYIAYNVDLKNTELVKKFDELIIKLDLQNC